VSKFAKPVEMSDGHRYWNGAGGDTWARTMEVSERNFATMSPVLMARAAPQPGEKVLDVGCGGGQTSRELAQRLAPGGEVTGMDISETLLKIAREQHGDLTNLSFSQADVGTAALPAGEFDLIYSRFGVMFFDQPVTAFGNMRQALKPNGRMVFMCWRAINLNPWMHETNRAAAAALPEEHRPTAPADPFGPGPFALGDKEHTRRLLADAGFTNVQIEPLDDAMHLGDEDTALWYLTELGPVASALKQVTADQAEAARQAMAKVLHGYASGGELNIPSATWIVTARS